MPLWAELRARPDSFSFSVFARTSQEKLSAVFRRRQVQAYRKVQAMPVDAPVRRLVCNEVGSPIIWNRSRKRGRPRQTWSESVYKLENLTI